VSLRNSFLALSKELSWMNLFTKNLETEDSTKTIHSLQTVHAMKKSIKVVLTIQFLYSNKDGDSISTLQVWQVFLFLESLAGMPSLVAVSKMETFWCSLLLMWESIQMVLLDSFQFKIKNIKLRFAEQQ
jgi:hypothetical protein